MAPITEALANRAALKGAAAFIQANRYVRGWPEPSPRPYRLTDKHGRTRSFATLQAISAAVGNLA